MIKSKKMIFKILTLNATANISNINILQKIRNEKSYPIILNISKYLIFRAKNCRNFLNNSHFFLILQSFVGYFS